MKKRSEEAWRTLFVEHEGSGLSVRAFCRGRGLCPKYFSVQRRQLSAPSFAKGPTAFVPVRVEGASHAPVLELYCDTGVRLRLPVSVSPEWLSALLRLLKT